MPYKKSVEYIVWRLYSYEFYFLVRVFCDHLVYDDGFYGVLLAAIIVVPSQEVYDAW